MLDEVVLSRFVLSHLLYEAFSKVSCVTDPFSSGDATGFHR